MYFNYFSKDTRTKINKENKKIYYYVNLKFLILSYIT